MKQIKKLVDFEQPTLLETEKGNELIEAINSFIALEFSPKGIGKLVLGGKKAVLQLRMVPLYIRMNGTIRRFGIVGRLEA